MYSVRIKKLPILFSCNKGNSKRSKKSQNIIFELFYRHRELKKKGYLVKLFEEKRYKITSSFLLKINGFMSKIEINVRKLFKDKSNEKNFGSILEKTLKGY